MSKTITIIIVVLVLGAAAFGGWYYFLRKSSEGGSCLNTNRCQTGLKCFNKTCSSGKVGSACSQKSDCTSGFCVQNICTEGIKGNTCQNYKDCQDGLLCLKKACSTPPDSSKYFTRVEISKIKPGSGPGPNNPPTITDTFTTADSLEMDFIGVKSTTVGEFYYEIVNPTTGEAVRSSKNEQALTLAGQDRGTGTSLDNVAPGEYDLNIYFNNELVFTAPIKVTK